MVYRIGIILSTLVGGYVFLYSKGLPYILVGIATIIAGCIILLMEEPHIDSEKFTLKNYIKQTKLGFAQLWKTRHIQNFSLYYISIGGITWYFVYFLLNVIMTDSGFNSVSRGWLSSINSLLVALVAIFVTRRNLLTKPMTYFFFPIVMLLGFLPLPFVPNIGVAVCLFLGYLVSITRFTFLDLYTNEEFESKYRATAISALNMSTSFVYFLLTFALNPILSKFGSSWVMFSLGVLTLLTTVPLSIVLLQNRKR